MYRSAKASVRKSVTPAFRGDVLQYIRSTLLVLACFSGASVTSPTWL
jgi:hypothetical protein